MARSLRIQFPGAFYHVLSRGNEKKSVFWEEDDYKYFLSLINIFCKKFKAVIHSYCLMDNHFHLFLETKEANLSTFMMRLLCSYSSRFNAKHKRVGHLFQGRYKAILVDTENYLLELSRYIHLNPCKAGIVKSPEAYNWSSMKYFLNGIEVDFLATNLILGQFKDQKSYKDFVLEGLHNDENILEKAVGGSILGSEEFVSAVKKNLTNLTSEGSISRKIEIEAGFAGPGLRPGPEYHIQHLHVS